jgi:prepilin-type N-terminal cleavage/methylation domain-containing protein
MIHQRGLLQFPAGRLRPGAGQRREGGFTLVEVIVAIGIVAVATNVIISWFFISVDVTTDSRSRMAAAWLAEEQLSAIQLNPGDYVWPTPEDYAAGGFHLVNPRDDESSLIHAVETPSAMPPDDQAYRRESNFYDKYSWTAYSRLPDPDAYHVETVVVIQWRQGARDRVFSLSSVIPRTEVENSA